MESQPPLLVEVVSAALFLYVVWRIFTRGKDPKTFAEDNEPLIWRKAFGTVRDDPLALPDITELPPDRRGLRFEMRANLSLMTGNEMGFTAAMGIFAALPVLKWAGVSQNVFLVVALAALIALPVLGMIMNRRIRKNTEFPDVLFEAYDSGIWFVAVGLFVPYERLLAINIEPQGRSTGDRPMIFTAQINPGDPERIKADWSRSKAGLSVGKHTTLTVQLPKCDGRAMPSYEESAKKIAELAAIRNAASGLGPPEVSIAKRY